MATPHVSGVANLVWSIKPELTASEVTEILTTTAVDVWSPGFDFLTGWGRISADQALQKAQTRLTFLPIIHFSDNYIEQTLFPFPLQSQTAHDVDQIIPKFNPRLNGR